MVIVGHLLGRWMRENGVPPTIILYIGVATALIGVVGIICLYRQRDRF
jgi:hypothetical protein